MAPTDLPELPAPHAELVNYIADHPEIPMVEIMEPYRKYEAELRSIFAQDRQNVLLQDPHVNVLPLFTENTKKITTRARDLAAESQEEKDRYIMALPDDKRRPHGSPAVVPSAHEFRSNFSVFSEGSLVDMDWNNVVAAGSSVVNCLLPVPPEFKANKRKLREYYHQKFCPASDVDLFLYGLTHEEAIEKIKQIEQAVRDAILTEVTVVRTKYAITIASQYPTRHVQVVLRVYKSIGEILTGFDIDAAGGAYDGKQVYVTPRALGSFITQINHVDLTRRSPSYENRLSKYSHRNFEVYWSQLDRSRVDPTIYERSFQRTLGLARLLVLERLPTSSIRDSYMNKRRVERGRPSVNRRRYRLFGNIKDTHEDEVADWVDETDVSSYHTFSVPYGEKFHAKKIEKLCYTRDLLLNAEWNQHKDRKVYLHRHPAFFGRVEDVIGDCCGTCPVPSTQDEIAIAKKEADVYISGPISFMIDDPGRQQIGSFNPLTDNDWTDMAYVGNTARLCQSIVDQDLDDIMNWLNQPGADPNQRDYTGRAPIHLAVLSASPQIVKCLVDHGSRITSRLADGRTPLHLAAERGDTEMIKILMDKSIENEEMEMEKEDARRKAQNAMPTKPDPEPVAKSESDTDEDSDGELVDDEDDDGTHSYATGSFVNVKKEEDDGSSDDAVPEESADDPDYYKIDVLAWDIPCSPLHLAIVAGHLDAVKMLCDYGGDSMLPVKFLGMEKEPVGAILTLTLAMALPLEKAKAMAKLLLDLGATCAQADMNGCTALHRYVENGQKELIDTLWENDPAGIKTALNHLVFSSQYWHAKAVAPLHTAIINNDPALVLRLLEAGANANIDFESWLKVAKVSKISQSLGDYEANKKMYGRTMEQPVIIAASTCPDPDVILTLVERGADVNAMTTTSWEMLTNEWSRRYNTGQSVLDLVRLQLNGLRNLGKTLSSPKPPVLASGMEEFLKKMPKDSYQYWFVKRDIDTKKQLFKEAMDRYAMDTCPDKPRRPVGSTIQLEAVAEAIEKFDKLEQLLLKRGAKSFKELHPDIVCQAEPSSTQTQQVEQAQDYSFTFKFVGVNDVTETRRVGYTELFDAVWAGDVEKIKSMTLQFWGKNMEEAPLQIAVRDELSISPFSLALLRGHLDAAKAIAEISLSQYSPEKAGQKTYTMKDEEEEVYSSEEDSEEDEDEPRIVGRVVDKPFTIDNVGQNSMQVKCKITPLTFMLWSTRTFEFKDGEPDFSHMWQQDMISFFLEKDMDKELVALLKLCTHFAAKKLKDDEESHPGGRFHFPEQSFKWAVEKGKVKALGEIIKRTGAGLPLDHLVKKSGVESSEKPKYYQGLTVYGKKRGDWAKAGRNLFVKPSMLTTSPLLLAALSGSLESAEWFLSDAPHRLYSEFGKSQVAREDERLKLLSQAAGGYDGIVAKWLGNQNELVLHCALAAAPSEESSKLVKYLIKACPEALEAKTGLGDTPLLTACFFGRVDCVQMLIKAGANQLVRNKAGENGLHCAMVQFPRADKLKLLLDAFDPEVRQLLLTQRTNLHDQQGATPLHLWILKTSRNEWDRPTGRPNKKDIEVVRVLLEYGMGAELEMLNGPGDTPLHSAILLNLPLVVKELLQFRPKLLYRENAVGRTPTELARERFVALRFKQPETVVALRAATNHRKTPFEKQAEEKKKPKLAPEEEIWQMCSAISRRFPEKRRLVSLNEANDVAIRLGDSYNASRYFSVQARDDEGEGSKEKEEDDEAVKCKKGNKNTAWTLAKKEEEEEKNKIPKCGTCGQQHAEAATDDEDDENDSDDSYESLF